MKVTHAPLTQRFDVSPLRDFSTTMILAPGWELWVLGRSVGESTAGAEGRVHGHGGRCDPRCPVPHALCTLTPRTRCRGSPRFVNCGGPGTHPLSELLVPF